MEFITPEQFLKEDKKVQEVINNSIKLCIGDRIYHKLSKKYYIYLGEYNEAFWNVFDLEDKCTSVICKDYFCRCFTEGELRQFIEDKTRSYFSCEIINPLVNEEGFRFVFEFYSGKEFKYNEKLKKEIYAIDLLQAYWQVAVQIAREEVLN